MTSDDQHFFDVLANVPNDIKKYSNEVADTIDRHFESVAKSLREALTSSKWLPDAAKPAPKPVYTPPPVPLSYYERAHDWVMKHTALTAAIIAFVGTGSFLIYRQRKSYSRKRRARRASNGARKDVVVIAGSPSDPITKSLALDLERRGFIVYIVVNTIEEEQLVRNESRVDIRPLNMNIVDPLSSQTAVEQFHRILVNPQIAFTGATPHHLNLSGIIVIPDMTYPSGPIEMVSPDLWSDALNIKVLGTIATTQVFLRMIRDFHARLLFLTPSIIPSLGPPFHGVETSVVAALDGFTTSLRAELGTMGIDVCQLKLGTFDCGSVGGRQHLQTSIHSTRADVLSWPATARAAYAKNYVAQTHAGNRSCTGNGNGNGLKGSPLRELHNAVFDALTQSRPKQLWRVGRGSLVYDVVGKWAPRGLVGWMMGVKRVSREELEEAFVPDVTGSVEWEKVDKLV
ncbi:DUF1776-domain-containing protein [Xylona heveae TC161]|uniref:DUF1776-domain-containing protein n=1 Tax=Xylona heveae (strain CBS 132557 / TC161) TaxID=1328760 RepID=A0A165JB42_XYLHT|nr:DUF1776-domain-containing protein [Xylona heveae TC161]KZF25997.1 DUF1776-domain-containing protein [Xylona heveae TC161]